MENKIEISSNIIDYMTQTVKKLDEKNGTNYLETITTKSIKNVPVSIIEVTEENKKFLSNKFSFSKSEWGTNAKINVGTVDNVQNYKEMPKYFDDNGLLKVGVSIMVQRENDIYLTEEKPIDLGYVPNKLFKKIKLEQENNEDFNLNDLMVVQNKEKIEDVVKFVDLFNIYNKVSLEMIKNPEDVFINTNKIQQLNKDGYFVLDKNKNISQLVNSDDNGLYAKGYIPREEYNENNKNVLETSINYNHFKLILENQKSKNTFDFSTCSVDLLDKISEIVKKIRQCNNSLNKNINNPTILHKKDLLLKEVFIIGEKYNLIKTEYKTEVNFVDTLITINSDNDFKLGLIKNKKNIYSVPKTLIEIFDNDKERKISKDIYFNFGLEIDKDNLDFLETKIENNSKIKNDYYQIQFNRKESKKAEINNKISFLNFEEVQSLLKSNKLDNNAKKRLSVLIKYDHYFKLKREQNPKLDLELSNN